MAIRAINPSATPTANIMVDGVNIGSATTGHLTLAAAELAAAASGDTLVYTAPMQELTPATLTKAYTLTADDSSWFGANAINKHAWGAGAGIYINGATLDATYNQTNTIERLQIKRVLNSVIPMIDVTGTSIVNIQSCTLHNLSDQPFADVPSGAGLFIQHCFFEQGVNAQGFIKQTGANLVIKVSAGLRLGTGANPMYQGQPADKIDVIGVYGGNAAGVSNGNPVFTDAQVATGASTGAGFNGSVIADAPGTTVYDNTPAASVFKNTNINAYDMSIKSAAVAALYPVNTSGVSPLPRLDIDRDSYTSGEALAMSLGPDFYVAPVAPAPTAPNLFDMSVPDGSDEFLTLDAMLTNAAVDGGSPTLFATPNPSFSVSPAKGVPSLSLGAPVGNANTNLWNGQVPLDTLSTFAGMVAQHQADGSPVADFIVPNPAYSVPADGLKAAPTLSLTTPAADPTRDNWLVPDMLNDPAVIASWTAVQSSELRLAAMDFMVPLNVPKFIPESGANGVDEVIQLSPILSITFDAPATAADPLIQTQTQLGGEVIAASDLGLLSTSPLLVYGKDVLAVADIDAQFVPNGLRFLVDASFAGTAGDPIYDAGGRASYIGVRTANGMVFRAPEIFETALYIKVTTDLMGQGIQAGTAVPIGFLRFEQKSFPVWHPYKPMPEKTLEAQAIYTMLDPDEVYRYYSLLASEMYIIWQDLNDELRLLLDPELAHPEWLDLLAAQYQIPFDQSKGVSQQRKDIQDWMRIPKIRGTVGSTVVPTRQLNYRVTVYEVWADPEDGTNWEAKTDAPAAIQAHMVAIGIWDAQVTESGQKGIDVVVVPHGFFHEVPTTNGNFYPTGRLAVSIAKLDHQPLPLSSLTTDEFNTLRDEIVRALNEVIPAHSDVRMMGDSIEVSPADVMLDPPHEAIEITDSLSTTTILFIIYAPPTLSGTFVIT